MEAATAAFDREIKDYRRSCREYDDLIRSMSALDRLIEKVAEMSFTQCLALIGGAVLSVMAAIGLPTGFLKGRFGSAAAPAVMVEVKPAGSVFSSAPTLD